MYSSRPRTAKSPRAVFELEAVANLAPGLKMVGAFTTYDLFISKDLNPALIGKVPTATPQPADLGLG